MADHDHAHAHSHQSHDHGGSECTHDHDHAAHDHGGHDHAHSHESTCTHDHEGHDHAHGHAHEDTETVDIPADPAERAEKALDYKAKGNALVGEKRWAEATQQYTFAITLDESNHIFFANRSACYMQSKDYEAALADATKCVELDSSWVKGYLRKAQAQCWLQQYSESECTCRDGLKLDKANKPLASQLQELRDAGHMTDSDADKALVDTDAAAAAKAKGNDAFKAKQFVTAIELFTEAMCANPFDHVFYSNRSACFSAQENFEKALVDAKRCVDLKSDWPKGYNRQSVAEWHLGMYKEAEASAAKGLELEPGNTALVELLRKAKVETAESDDVQAQMHKMRAEQRQNKKLMSTLQGIPGLDMSRVNMSQGFGGSMGNSMNETQMRQMARAMATGEGSIPMQGGQHGHAPSKHGGG